jgi:hypothetical protein
MVSGPSVVKLRYCVGNCRGISDLRTTPRRHTENEIYEKSKQSFHLKTLCQLLRLGKM